jgi:Uma2 family endonuclease
MIKTIIKLGPQDAGMRLAAEEFANADFQEPYIYERVKGRLVVMSPAGPDHRKGSRPFRRELGLFWGTHRDLVEDVDVEGWVETSPDDDRIPDICVYLVGSGSDKTVPHRVPDIIFEFVSADRADQERDYIDKRAEYHAIGVKEYVIVDRFKEQVLVLTWGKKDFAERSLSATDTYTSRLLPGLEVPLQEVFE